MSKGKLYRVSMRFSSPLHIGEKEKIYNITQTFAHSDTLMSGIINAYSLLYGNSSTNELLDGFLRKSPPFEVSSTMPYVQGEFFVPKPVGLNLHHYKDEGKIEVENDKELKKIKFIRENDLLYNFPDKYKVAGSFLLPKDMLYKFVESKKAISLGKVKERARVSIDRLSSSSNIYYFSHFEFESSAGLWFYLRINDQSLEEKIKAAIRLLGDEGLGGDRTCGLGSFEANFEESSMPEENDSAKYYMSLSLVNPQSEDEIKNAISYEILTRSGYIYSKAGLGIKRKAVRVFSEGTVFSGKVCGRVVDVTPQKFSQHRVYCFALAFLLPLPEGVMMIDS
ncbi:CRISPR-associated RAMP protein, Csm4 family [Caldicellulosiruptor acetigenus I77R1B]|uniref:CRISPR system Cms protein Csm4 n=1 Tax=Caldicellulosiruptor acetigenus (strain ATCC 700853 / DSM 12137 / I77R1B) TaxID=632335 RepID=E4S8J0_CALA7|nr:type III-A CRISPR-associated RAMP protein Csm4 [Caldicellulosiruptor acetigenus]ADQ41972.1 CRISPR-associated RAMP protein, Csm4 family [Caldicellulosiruptor acetigenus I77R1B]